MGYSIDYLIAIANKTPEQKIEDVRLSTLMTNGYFDQLCKIKEGEFNFLTKKLPFPKSQWEIVYGCEKNSRITEDEVKEIKKLFSEYEVEIYKLEKI